MTSIPLEILKINKGYHILCRLHLKNKEYRMLVDTGASLTMLDIKNIDIVSDGVIENEIISTGFGEGNIVSKFVNIEEFRLGDIIINNFKMMFIDFKNLNNHFKTNGFPLIDGVIGGDILYKYNVIIDYRNREMILSP